MIRLRIIGWDMRRRMLAMRMRRRGAVPYEVIAALRDDARRHPHPVG